MATFSFQYSWDKSGTLNGTGTTKEYMDDSLWHSTSTAGHSHIHDNGGAGFKKETRKLKFTVTFNKTSGFGNNRIRFRIRNRSTGVYILSTPWVNVPDNGTKTIAFTWLPVGDPEGTPTYLETLDKMDQWSTAQYVPYGKSGNELNHRIKRA